MEEMFHGGLDWRLQSRVSVVSVLLRTGSLQRVHAGHSRTIERLPIAVFTSDMPGCFQYDQGRLLNELASMSPAMLEAPQ